MLKRYSKLLLIGLFLTLTGFFNFSPKVFAAVSTDISMNVLPSNPAPNADVNISLNSYVNNLDIVLITWSVNGKNILSGIGKKIFSTKAGAPGTATVVTATIALPDGIVTNTVTIRPSVMVLLWQADDSYVPPFYKGKAMPSPDSEVKVVAMPEIKTVSGLANPQNMTYSWQKDYTNNVDGSGYGKNAFIYVNDYLQDTNNISVTASTVDQQYSVDASVDIGTTQPKILFYKNDSALGTVWDNALTDSHKIQGPEIVQAAPYFISPAEIQNPRLIWNWFINDEMVDVLGFQKNLMPLIAQAGLSGISTLKLELSNQDKVFETASKEINIEF
jgi:hypothetical protein